MVVKDEGNHCQVSGKLLGADGQVHKQRTSYILMLGSY